MIYYLKVYALNWASWVKLCAIISTLNVCILLFFFVLYWPHGSAEGYTFFRIYTDSAFIRIALFVVFGVSYVGFSCLFAFALCPVSNFFLRKLGGVQIRIQLAKGHDSREGEKAVDDVLISWWRIFSLGLIVGIGCILFACLVGFSLWALGLLSGSIRYVYSYSVVFILCLVLGASLVDSLAPKLPSLFGGIRLRGNMVLINPRVREEPVSTTLLGSEKLRQLYDAWKSFWELGRKG